RHFPLSFQLVLINTYIKDKETAINHFVGKIQRVRGKIDATQKMLANKMLEREQLRKAAAKKYHEENQKGNMDPFPAFHTS
ncbi:unnamed protein product, partial [Larinioides sclopetarius]